MGCTAVPVLLSHMAVVGGGGGSKPISISICFRLYKKSEATHDDTPTVEGDFSACGNLLIPNPSRIDTYWVEMVMVLKANFEHIPDHGAILMIAGKDIRACLPTRFTGKDADLVAAEAAFDVLNNPAASTTQDMGMDKG